ncbi:hypothetical protein MMC08_003949 [Hypocenomyce scalaris]|nr:hypothetical protein [Hypocenomyce scalaris]
MPSEDYMSDDYVASILTQDANDSTMKYSALGLQALLPKRPTSQAPRPNTRFLKNILRETDNHNEALRAKEAEEARARARRLREANGIDKGTAGREERRHRSRYEVKDDKPSKRRRVEISDDDDEMRRRRHEESRSHRSERHRDQKSGRRHGRDHDKDGYTSESDDERKKRHHRHHHHSRRERSWNRSGAKASQREGRQRSRHRSRSRSPDRDKDAKHHKSRRRQSSSKERRETRSPSTAKPERSGSQEPNNTTGSAQPHVSRASSLSSTSSDPLASLIGPPPPPQHPKILPRGRGALTSTTAIDTHFSSTYDPSTDIHPNSDSENDWDQALEALKDRQRWKQQGADRLRSAGFTEEEVSKWEKGGETREEDVVWRRPGEGREWDRGKVVAEDGSVETRSEWGRLKGT